MGIDVALSSPEQAIVTEKNASYVDGPPILAIEVLSPYDKKKDIDEMIDEYLDLLAKKEDFERQIDTLRYQKAAMSQNDYEQQLKVLLVGLARIQAALDQ